MDEQQKKLFDDLRGVFENGSEEEVRAFLVDHISAFPDDIKDEIVFAFFEEGLDKAIEEKGKLVEFEEAGIEELKTLAELKRRIDDRIKVMELEEKL